MTDENKTIAVLTTINQPNNKVGDWFEITNNRTIVVGDNKTPQDWYQDKCTYYSISDQKKSEFKISLQLPENHYTRKNLAYLFAIKAGATRIIDTDDDNFPNISEWEKLLKSEFEIFEHAPSEKLSFKNIYSYFSNSDIPFWPRGFPLNLVNLDESNINLNDITKSHTNDVSLWQCMVHGDPDIDAIHRLIFKSAPNFINKRSILMGNNIFCAFNSQNTLWLDSDLFPLLYLPSTVSFRFTDILRGYIAQSVINSSFKNWGFYRATSIQERNNHNLMNDFRSEISMYSNMEEIFQIIYESCKSTNSIIDNLINCYDYLGKNKFIQDNELTVLDAWITDIKSL
jgi:hypothetical protein